MPSTAYEQAVKALDKAQLEVDKAKAKKDKAGERLYLAQEAHDAANRELQQAVSLADYVASHPLLKSEKPVVPDGPSGTVPFPFE